MNDDGSLSQLYEGVHKQDYQNAVGPSGPGGYKLVLSQDDGSLKIMDGNNFIAALDPNNDCASHTGPFKFVLQVDGHLVVYSSTGM